MVKKCVAGGCANSYLSGKSIHKFPTNQQLKRQWVRFVQEKRADFKEPSVRNDGVVLCGDHFGPESFVSPLMNVLGYKKQKKLKPDAIPTIHARASARPTVSKRRLSTRDADRAPVKQRRAIDKLSFARMRTTDTSICEEAEIEVGETETVEVNDERSGCASVSTGTQCSAKRPYFRSKETSTERVMMVDATTQTEASIPVTSTPVKCQPCFTDDLLESPVVSQNDKKDPTYIPSNLSFEEASDTDSTGNEESEWDMTDQSRGAVEERKYIVFESKLLALFTKCPFCDHPTRGEVVKEVGSLVNIQVKCVRCQAITRDWNSQPYSHKMPQGNLVASAAILVAGCLPSQALRMFSIMNVAMHNRSSFHRHQRSYIIPTIVAVWQEQQNALFQQLQGMEDGLELAGDGRSDSPGHCAKFGGYSIMEQRLNKIIDIQLVQSNEVGNSNACELEGLKRSIHQLTNVRGLRISTLVTDRHMQINAYIRDDLIINNPLTAGLIHYFDVWHVAKGLKKKLDALGKQAGMGDVMLWKKSIINHLYFCASSVPQNQPDLLAAKWVSISNHMNDIHEHEGVYEMCDHAPLINEEDRDKEWLMPGSPVSEKLSDVLEAPRLVKDIKRLSPRFQTSSLEAFHSLILRFAPKHTQFMWLAQTARYYLAALHYNENSDRPQALTADGQPRISVRFPKFKKGDYSVRKDKAPATYDYTQIILSKLMEKYQENPRHLKDSIPDLRGSEPPALATGLCHPTRAEALDHFMQRFPNM